MKLTSTLLCASILCAMATSQAAPKTLLFCKNIDRTDLKDIVIHEVSSAKSNGLLEIQESLTDGGSITRTLSAQDLKDGYVSLSKDDETKRTLVRKDGSWAVLENAGDYNSYYHAECVE
ncbi:hypothetical protein [Bdellovibrio svalbardensis]|uniref:C-type lysozyme inhibitor domain-containing protein n=1 Tax=Bdellovibrio svalbardensis TaxID=2972972 RepID=A0ABT6DI61_9BACT|nr:hypothetical protein [Bdellovibrio svalbardensis]MDG0815614.1 hypothetical protein [Bdellovibrio svalbardensis]